MPQVATVLTYETITTVQEPFVTVVLAGANPVTALAQGIGYSLVGVGSGVLVYRLVTTGYTQTWQIVVFLFAVLFVVVFDSLIQQAIAPVPGFDYSVVATSSVSILYILVLYRFDLFAFVPVAREHVFDDITDAVLVVNPDHQIIDYNEAAVSMLDGDVRVGDAAEDVLPTAIATDDHVRRLTDGRTTVHVTDDGTSSYYDVGVSTLTPAGETSGVAITLRDVTDRKRRERALERYEQLVESLPIGVYQNTPGPDGHFTLLNDAMVDLFDARSKAHLREQSVSDLYSDPDTRQEFSDRLVANGVVKEEEVQLETLSGEKLWGAVTAITRDVDGDTVFDGVIQDITERVEYERRLKEQRDNLDVLNQMLRHDIRNDLQLVTAYGDLLAEELDEDADRRAYVQTLLESAEHAIDLTRSARDMADVMLASGDTREPTDLRATLVDELEEVRSAHPDAVVAVDGSIPRVRVRADDMLGSVFRNLLNNAVQHNDGDDPHVSVSVTERDDEVTVRIADDGPGVPDDQKETIFGKGEKGLESDGTGIGLYLVQTLVDHYGGDVRVEDVTTPLVPGDGADPDDGDVTGAVFVVELPMVE